MTKDMYGSKDYALSGL